MPKQPYFFTDIDGVLLDFNRTACALLATLVGEEVSPQDLIHYDYQESLGALSIHIKEFWERMWDLPLIPHEGAADLVRALKERGCYVMGVTQRPSQDSKEASYRDTKQLGLDSLYVLRKKESKSEIINRHIETGLSSHLFFIDDKIQNVIEVVEHCPEVHVFLLDRPWNQSLDVAGYQRVDSYQDVLQQVDKILGEVNVSR